MSKENQLDFEPHCAQCGVLLDGFTGVGNDQAPEEGSICICLYCVCVHIVEGQTFRKATIAELEELARESPEFRAAVFAAVRWNHPYKQELS